MKNYQSNHKLNSLLAVVLTYLLCSCQSTIQQQKTVNTDTLPPSIKKKDSVENVSSTINLVDTSQYAQFVKKFKPLKLPLQFSFDTDINEHKGSRIKNQEVIQFICEAPNECFYARNFQLTTYYYVGRLNVNTSTNFLIYKVLEEPWIGSIYLMAVDKNNPFNRKKYLLAHASQAYQNAFYVSQINSQLKIITTKLLKLDGEISHLGGSKYLLMDKHQEEWEYNVTTHSFKLLKQDSVYRGWAKYNRNVAGRLEILAQTPPEIEKELKKSMKK
jgi:hypothetical protein